VLADDWVLEYSTVSRYGVHLGVLILRVHLSVLISAANALILTQKEIRGFWSLSDFFRARIYRSLNHAPSPLPPTSILGVLLLSFRATPQIFTWLLSGVFGGRGSMEVGCASNFAHHEQAQGTSARMRARVDTIRIR
jgi:hypothetical protein